MALISFCVTLMVSNRMGECIRTVKKGIEVLLVVGREIGLEANAGNTECKGVSGARNAVQNDA